MQAVTIDEKTFAFPESWNECTHKQAAVLADLLLEHKLTEAEFYLSLALNWVGLTDRRVVKHYFALAARAAYEEKNMKSHFYQDAFLNLKSEYYIAGKRCEWATADEPRLTRQLFPSLLNGKYVSVKDGLTDMSYIEYIAAERAMKAYHAAGEDKVAKEEALTDMLCALYAPKGEKGARQPLADDDVYGEEERRKDLQTVSLQIKQVNYLFFESCMVNIVETFPRIFHHDDEHPAGNNDKLGPARTIIELSGDKFGPYKETQKAELFAIFTHLENEAKKYDEFKSKYGN